MPSDPDLTKSTNQEPGMRRETSDFFQRDDLYIVPGIDPRKPEDLDKLKRLRDAADAVHPLPWGEMEYGGTRTLFSEGPEDDEGFTSEHPMFKTYNKAVGLYIAAAANAVPALLEEIDRLTRELRERKEQP